MNNGKIKKPNAPRSNGVERLRISVAVFYEKENGPLDIYSLVDVQRPRLYRNVKNYRLLWFECYQKGLMAIETVLAILSVPLAWKLIFLVTIKNKNNNLSCLKSLFNSLYFACPWFACFSNFNKGTTWVTLKQNEKFPKRGLLGENQTS